MKTNEFISELRAAPSQPLIFESVAGHRVQAGYHLTELKAASLRTVDCGGKVNQWPETIIQLWVPPDPDDEYITAGKFLKIFDRVRGMIPLETEAEIRVEYGDENIFPSTYHVRSVSHDRGSTCVLLEPPEATCKARERRNCSEKACCA